MKLNNFDDFIETCDYINISKTASAFVDKEMASITSFTNLEEILGAYAKGSSAANSNFFINMLKAYHEWLQVQLENHQH